MKILTIYSDNASPYRVKWAEELSHYYLVRFCYQKTIDKERNSGWLVAKSKLIEMVKLKSFIVLNKPFGTSVVKDIKKNKSDIYIFDGYGIPTNAYAIRYLKKHRIKHFINIDGFHMDVVDNWVKRKIKLYLLNDYSYLLCGSEYVVDHYVANYKVDKSKCCANNFTSIKEEDLVKKPATTYEKSFIRKRLDIPDRITIMGVGRFLDWKMFDVLIKAFSQLPLSYQLLLIGEGPERSHLSLLGANMSKHNIIIKPFMDYDTLVNYYTCGDLLVLPSRGEVWGLVVNEAMSCGLPVITSDTCVAGKSLLGEEVIFKTGDVNDLVRKIIYALDNKKRLGKQNLSIITNYTIENTAKKNFTFIESILPK